MEAAVHAASLNMRRRTAPDREERGQQQGLDVALTDGVDEIV